MSRLFLIFSVAFVLSFSTGCGWFAKGPPQAKIQRIAIKVAWSAGSTLVDAIIEEATATKFDPQSLLGTAVVGTEHTGLAPSDKAALMLVNKKTNEVKWYELTDHVKNVKLRNENPGKIELKVITEKPLRVELWFESDIECQVFMEFN